MQRGIVAILLRRLRLPFAPIPLMSAEALPRLTEPSPSKAAKFRGFQRAQAQS